MISECYAVEIFSRHGLCPLVPLERRKPANEYKVILTVMSLFWDDPTPSTHNKRSVNSSELS